MRALFNKLGKDKRIQGVRTPKISKQVLRAKSKKRLVRTKKKREMKAFIAEIRERSDEGFSARQLMRSHIPEIGAEVKVAAAEVTAALEKHEVDGKSGKPPGQINFLLGGPHYWGAEPLVGGCLCGPFFV